jgi:hypothetical protein
MRYSRPWFMVNNRYRATATARGLSQAFSTERIGQSSLPIGHYRRKIPQPFLNPAAKAVLVCQVLVPNNDVARAGLWQLPPDDDPFNLGTGHVDCVAELLVHFTGGPAIQL